jgi:hypothetical protein
MYLCVYLPEELDLVEKSGPWTEQFHWGLSDTLKFRPECRPAEWKLLQWVALDREVGESFPTDGRLYVFSALRPAPPPEGSLHLTAVQADWLDACVVGLVVVVGLVLVPLGAGRRVFVAGLFAIALVVCAVFYPILIWQVCDGVLAGAVVIVLVVWVVWYFVWTRPRAIAARRAAQPPPGPPSEAGEETSPAESSDEQQPKASGDEGGQADA